MGGWVCCYCGQDHEPGYCPLSDEEIRLINRARDLVAAFVQMAYDMEAAGIVTIDRTPDDCLKWVFTRQADIKTAALAVDLSEWVMESLDDNDYLCLYVYDTATIQQYENGSWGGEGVNLWPDDIPGLLYAIAESELTP